MFVCRSTNRDEDDTQYINMDTLNRAFDIAEQETSDWFNGQTCSMENRRGESECPICFFRRRAKIILGLGSAWPKEHNADNPPERKAQVMTTDILKRWIASLDVPTMTDIYQTNAPNIFYASFALPLYAEHRNQFSAIDVSITDTTNGPRNRYMLKWNVPSDDEE